MNVPASGRVALFLVATWLGAHTWGADSGALQNATPERTVTVGDTTVTVALPDAQLGYYRSTRFVWGGMVTQVHWRGHTYFTELKRPHDPLHHDGASGGAEEFGIDNGGLGYDQAKPGERFAKIGVGALQRIDDQKYQFNGPYSLVEVAPWVVTNAPQATTFVQDYRLNGDWAWHYTITVRVLDNGFALERHLENRGLKSIVTDHYNHHMFAVDDQPIDASWTLRLPRDIVANYPSPAYHLTDGILTLTAPLSNTLWTDFKWDEKRTTTDLTLTCGTARTAISISTDKAQSKFVLYAEKTAFCPEPFVAINLEPGAGMRWTTTYRLSPLEK